MAQPAYLLESRLSDCVCAQASRRPQWQSDCSIVGMSKESLQPESNQARHASLATHSVDAMNPDTPGKRKQLLSRFNPKEIGFGIVAIWGPSGKITGQDLAGTAPTVNASQRQEKQK